MTYLNGSSYCGSRPKSIGREVGLIGYIWLLFPIDYVNHDLIRWILRRRFEPAAERPD